MVRNEDIELMRNIGVRLERELRNEIMAKYEPVPQKRGLKKNLDPIELLLSLRNLINALHTVRIINEELVSKHMKTDYDYLKYASLLMKTAECLNVPACIRVFQEVHIDPEVEIILKDMIKSSDVASISEAKEVCKFLTKIPVFSWSQADSGPVDLKIVKLVSKDEYAEIMARSKKDGIYNLTPSEFQKVRMCYESKKIYRPNGEVKIIQERLQQMLGTEYMELIDVFERFFMDRKVGTYYICISE